MHNNACAISTRMQKMMSRRPRETAGSFRQQAVATANLLLEAANRLDGENHNVSEAAPDSRSQRMGNLSQSSNVQNDRGQSLMQTTLLSPGEREMRNLFNWNARTSTGKRKGRASVQSKPKKKKIPTWTHTFVCLAHRDDDLVPDSQERATLKLAGLGEKRVTLPVLATALEVCDELRFQYPRLADGGGFELLRASDASSKDLEVIKAPEGGHTVDYLKAVIHSAKIYIRPLQKDLDLSPCSVDVSASCMSYNVLSDNTPRSSKHLAPL